MGQYWLPVNLTKKEFIDPHKLGTGLKLWEQLANHPGTGAALIILTAAMPEQRGGGDLDLDSNWHGPERKFPEHNTCPGPMPSDYQDIAHRTIGRWAGDNIALVGDYGELGDAQGQKTTHAGLVYGACMRAQDGGDAEEWDTNLQDHGVPPDLRTYYMGWTDITDDVCRVIEHELKGKFEGSGWREFNRS